MNQSTYPYEFLVRFGATGQLGGMHYATRTVYTDDAGTVLLDKANDPQPVAVGSEALAQVLATLNAAALAQVQDLTARLATSDAARTAALEDAAAKATLIEQLQAQLAAATAPALTPTQNAAQQAAAAVFDALPAGKRALWEPVRVAVDGRLAVGDLAGAAEIIATVPEIYEGMEADRTAFLALFAAPAPAAT